MKKRWNASLWKRPYKRHAMADAIEMLLTGYSPMEAEMKRVQDKRLPASPEWGKDSTFVHLHGPFTEYVLNNPKATR